MASGHEIAAAVQRIGTSKSAPVDNFNQGGGSAMIDLVTGRVGPMRSPAYRGNGNGGKDGPWTVFDCHPDTGSQICGLVIPRWEELKSAVMEITRKLPFFAYIAWDWVLTDTGFALIETNMKSSLNLFQIHGGLRRSRLGELYRQHGYLVEKWESIS